MRYLITQSLLSSWAYTFDCFEGNEDKAYQEFLSVLHRERSEPSDAMLKGIEFENLCYSIADGTFQPVFSADGTNSVTGEVMGHYEYPRFYTGAKKIAEIISGAPVQVKASKEVVVGGITFLVYGILDALKAGTMQQETAGIVPVDYYASVFIHETALRKVPDIYAPIEDTAHHGDILHIIAEHEDGLCKTDNGLWVLGAALRNQ